MQKLNYSCFFLLLLLPVSAASLLPNGHRGPDDATMKQPQQHTEMCKRPHPQILIWLSASSERGLHFILCHGAMQAPLAKTDYKERQRWRAADRDSCGQEGWKWEWGHQWKRKVPYPHCVRLKHVKCIIYMLFRKFYGFLFTLMWSVRRSRNNGSTLKQP